MLSETETEFAGGILSWGTTAIADNNPQTKMERRHTETLILIQIQSEQIEATPPVSADQGSSSPGRTSTSLCQKKTHVCPLPLKNFMTCQIPGITENATEPGPRTRKSRGSTSSPGKLL